MFSGSFRHPAKGQRSGSGFSQIELIGSILLIAAIAVLSFPTFQDFKPHAQDPGASIDHIPASDFPDRKLNSAGAKTPTEPGSPIKPREQDAGESTRVASERVVLEQGGKGQ